MKTKITLFCAFIFFFLGISAFSQTVSGTPTTSGCLNGGIVTASNNASWASPQYQLLKAGNVIAPVPNDAAQFTTNPVFVGLSTGSYTVKGRNTSAGTVFTSTAIAVNDGYTVMKVATPTQITGCATGAEVLTTTVTGGKQPFTYNIALQSSPGVSIQNSGAINAASFAFNALPAGSYIVSVTDSCGQTVTGATAVSVATVTLADLKQTGFYPIHWTDYNCSTPFAVSHELGFQYVANSTSLSVADAALFTWKIKYQGKLYGQDTDGDGYSDEGGNGYPITTRPIKLPKTATRDDIFADINNMRAVVFDKCGNTREFALIQWQSGGYMNPFVCGGEGMIKVVSNRLACFPVNLKFTNLADASDVVEQSINLSMLNVGGFKPGATYHLTYVDAGGNTTNDYWAVPTNQNITIPSAATLSMNQSLYGVQPNQNVLGYGKAMVSMSPSVSDSMTFTILASDNPLAPVGSTGTGVVDANGTGTFAKINAGDPTSYWPKGNYTVQVNTACGTKNVNLVVQGYNATLSGYTAEPICGGFNYTMKGTFSDATAFQVIVVSGPSNVGQVRDLASTTASLPFNGLNFGTYVFGLRIKGGGTNVFTQTVTYDASNTITVDKTNTGGFVCTAGAADGSLTIVAATISPAPNNTLQYALSTNLGVSFGPYQASNQFTGLTNGIYHFRVQDGCGNVITQTAQIGVAAAPTATANGLNNPTLCKLGAGVIQLDVDILNAVSYLWSGPGITAANQNLKSPQVNYTALAVGANNYTCAVTLGAPCNTTNTANLTITLNPLPNITITNPPAVCFPNTVSLTGNAITAGSDAGLTYSYFTDSAGTITLSNAQAISISGTYYIKGTNANGCSFVSPVVVTINPLPLVLVVTPAAVCTPATVDITTPAITAGSTAGLTFTYYTDAAGTLPLGSPQAIAASGTYYIKGTNPVTGCSNITGVVVKVNPSPAVTITNPIICQGTSFDLSAAKTGNGTSYTYFAADQITILPSSIVTPSVTTDYYVQTLGTNGCTSAKEKITVTVIQTPVVLVTNPPAVCEGTAVDITAPAVTAGSTPGLTYTYYTNAAATSVLTNPNAVTQGDIYYIKGTTTNGCFAISPVTVTINVNPIPSFTYSIINNANDTYLFTNTSTSLGISNGITFNWDFGDGTTSGLESPVHQYTASGTYTVTLAVTSINGCPANVSENIVITKNPNVAAGFVLNDADQCLSGNSYSFISNSTVAAGYTITNYNWDFGDGSPLNNSVNPSHIYAAAGNYTVTLTAEATNGINTFSDSASSSVIVFETPNVVVTNPPPVCEGNTVDLTDNNVTIGSTTNTTFSYYTDPAATQFLANADAIAASGTYYIKGTNISNCSNIQPVTVTINPLPNLAITDPAPVCEGAAVDLTSAAVTTGSSTGLTYSYYNDAAGTYILANPDTVTISNTYYIKGTNTNGCDVISPVNVVINALPTASFDYFITNNENDNYSFNNSSSSGGSTTGLTYKWDFGDGTTDTAQMPSHQYAAAGDYTVNLEVTNANGCTASTSQNLTVTKTQNAAAGFTINILDQCLNTNNYVLNDTSNLASGYAIISYEWDFGDGSLGDNTANPSHIYTTSGTFIITLTITATNQISTFSDSASSSVTVSDNPTVVLTNPLPVCSDTAVDLTAAAITDGSTVGLSYSYFYDALTLRPLPDPQFVTTSGTYYIKGTNVNGCSETAAIAVTVNPMPDLVVTNPAAVCAGSSVDLTAAAVTAGSTTGLAYSYYTDSLGTISLSNPEAITIGGTYYIKGTTSSECAVLKPVVVTVNSLPTAAIAYPDNPYCKTGTASVVQSGQTGGSYSSTSGLSIDNSSGAVNLALSIPGTYTVIYSFTDGLCTNTAEATVTINDLVSLQKPESTICAADGLDYVLNITVSGQAPYTAVGTGAPGSWSGNLWTSDAIKAGTNYSVNIQDAFACNVLTVANTAPSCCLFEVVCPTFPAVILNCYDELPNTSSLTIAQFEALGNGDGSIGDNPCGVIVITAVNGANPGCSGTVVRTYIVTEYDDANNNNVRDTGENTILNSTVCTQSILIQDTIVPVFAGALPEPIVNADCNTIPPAVVLSAVDNCGAAIVNYTETQLDGECSSRYSLVRIWTANDDCGNQTTYTQIVNVSCLSEIYNAISPNADGKNDSFVISGIDCYPNNTVRIYNRYGVVVYEKEGYDNITNPFKGYSDGRSTVKRGDKLPTGTYFYTVQYDNAGNQIEKSGYLFINNQ
ncbi:PKD domain-containing protein [Flavobacterium sp. FlaQc-30]|uniref:PKD domain-containing protein n=1 Tax=Flavobacterium sp. FlaQc-30 TaxID=3374179 RepID=UPI0037569B6D